MQNGPLYRTDTHLISVCPVWLQSAFFISEVNKILFSICFFFFQKIQARDQHQSWLKEKNIFNFLCSKGKPKINFIFIRQKGSTINPLITDWLDTHPNQPLIIRLVTINCDKITYRHPTIRKMTKEFDRKTKRTNEMNTVSFSLLMLTAHAIRRTSVGRWQMQTKYTFSLVIYFYRAQLIATTC